MDRLSPAETRQLHHLLTCPLCGPAATLHIDVADGLRAPRRRKAAPPEPVPDPAARRSAERRVKALLSLPPEVRRMRVRDEPRRYARPAVAEILLEASARAQTVNPEDSYELAMLAVCSLRTGGLEQARPILRAELLMANAARLAGRLGEAETVLDRVAPFLIAPDLRGVFCRLRALVLWERGRLEEAHGLLRQAVNRFAEAGLAEEEGASQALLGLLLREMGEGERCFAALARALTLPFAERRPWLGVRVALMVAWVCSECETPANAWPIVVWADRLFGPGAGRRPNLAFGLREKLGRWYGAEPAPEEILGYVHAVLSSPSYRRRYRELLLRSFPRVVFPRDPRRFAPVSALGRELIGLQLLQDARLHEGLPEEIEPSLWEARIGGYPVLPQWLRARRGRDLQGAETLELRRIAKALGLMLGVQSDIEEAAA